MTARDTIQMRLKRLRRQSEQTGQVRLPVSAVAAGVETVICFLLSAVLAGAVIFEESAPFGCAMTAAAGTGLYGGAALLGACFGYLILLEFAQALRYVSACVLTFAAAFAFYDSKLFRRKWVVPLIAGMFNGFTGIIVRSKTGWTQEDVIFFGLEVGITVAAAWCYRGVLQPARRGREENAFAAGRQTGILVLAATVLTALVPLCLYRDLSVGRILAALSVLIAARQGGAGMGCAVGTALGGAVDLAGGKMPLFAAVYAMAGLGAGLQRGRQRIYAALPYGLISAGAALWLWEQELALAVLYEGMSAVVIFLLLPERLLRRIGVWIAPEPVGAADLHGRRMVKQKLESTAGAFRALCDSLGVAARPPKNDNDIASVFDRAAGRICRNCALRGRCWQQGYTDTFNALNDATPAMVNRGRAEAADFPRHFADRCVRFSELLSAVNEELNALFYRRQYNARIRENRAAVCRQYSQLSELLGDAAAELSRELVPDLMGDRKLRARMAELGLNVRTAVYRDSRGLLRVEAEGADRRELTRGNRVSEVSELLGVPLRVEQDSGESVSLLQEEPLMAVAGVAARKKNGETVSGDAGTYFKRMDGVLFVLLCDGMGSGQGAYRESSLAVQLLEQFLMAGVKAEQALATLSSALALRGEEQGGFTTVDLLQVDLFTGEGALFKLGGAPTYVKQGGQVRRLSCRSLPAGLENGGPERFDLHLKAGDCVLMVSDGICGTGDDSWISKRLEQFDGAGPKELARDLIVQSPTEATDDRTALAVCIEKRKRI